MILFLFFVFVFVFCVSQVEAAISPGLTMLNWNSLNIPKYLRNIYVRLREVDLLIKEVKCSARLRRECVCACVLACVLACVRACVRA